MSGPAIIVQARMGSYRFPDKVLADLQGKPMLERLLERLALAEHAELVLATSVDASDDPVAATGERLGAVVHRGPMDDVLRRYVQAARLVDADPIVRITADCPLADPALISAMLERWEEERAADPSLSLLTNVRPPTYPDGLDVEIVSRAALERADMECDDAAEREHVLLHLHRRPETYLHVRHAAATDRSGSRWTVDYPADLEFVRAVYRELYPVKGATFTAEDVFALLAARPEIAALEGDARRNEALLDARD